MSPRIIDCKFCRKPIEDHDRVRDYFGVPFGYHVECVVYLEQENLELKRKLDAGSAKPTVGNTIGCDDHDACLGGPCKQEGA